MKQIIKHVYHWTTFHEGIGVKVHSYYIIRNNMAFLIDPRIPAQGLKWFEKHVIPSHIYLTNRLHYRHSAEFAKAFHCKIWCHKKGLHHFSKKQNVFGFEDKQRLPGGVMALNIDAICPEETVLHIPMSGGIIAIADALIRERGKIQFVDDYLLGDNPELIKEKIMKQFQIILRRKFCHILFAHGQPILVDGKDHLRAFLKSC